VATSVALYLLLLLVVAVERAVEVTLSSRNRRWSLARGGVEYGRAHYPWMVAVHALLLISCAVEVAVLGRPFIPAFGLSMLAVVFATMILRYWAIATLGRRWNTRVIVISGLPLVAGGPYRFLRHPNYVAVMVEVAALPLVHCAWWTALLFSLADAVVLGRRIAVENAALQQFETLHPEDYGDGR
jgi:methyltransferase